jgi:hypothetical protein
MSEPKRIPRIPQPSPLEFYQRYVRDPRPVVLTGAMETWPARSKWSFEWLTKTHGSVELPVEFGKLGKDPSLRFRHQRMTIADYVASLSAADEANRGYIANLDLLPLIPALKQDFSFPRYSLWHSLFGIGLYNFWIGPDGKYSQLHCDYVHNFHAVIVGSKRFRLYSPVHTPLMRVSRSSWYSAYSELDYVDTPGDASRIPVEPEYDDLVEPGEILFLPYGWWHAVTGVGNFMTISLFWPTTHMLVTRGPSALAGKLKNMARRRWRQLRGEGGRVTP